MEPKIWQRGLELSAQSRGFCLCTIVESRGSVPRRLGASLIVADDGSTLGTVGGGILEQLAIEEARAAIAAGRSHQRAYNLDDAEKQDTGAVCGGTVTLFFDVHRPARVCHLFGAGHVAIPVARLLASVGYAVKVYDDSPAHANRERFPEAAAIVPGDPVLSARDAVIHADDAVVIMTASHDTDYAIVREFRDRLPAYLGVIGSKVKARHYREKLAAEGWPYTEIERIHSPIGLAIGSRTPEEIAVSIAAEMIALRGPVE